MFVWLKDELSSLPAQTKLMPLWVQKNSQEMIIVHQGHPISDKPGTVSVQQCRRCAKEACSLYIRYADQADDKADVVLLNAYRK
ncbi:MAG: hypothetical protein A2520_09030 [Deltaproteobacteria bacterium RIFOXYD12_FULL_53_23]|nr:MAG: hypothetical protein A2520_09030 [Deltaproteobacteria bacterium RIFOXYD12_FULL_53_23]